MAQEEIFDSDELYRRFPKLYLRPDGTLSPGAFHNTSGTDKMSVELAKLTIPQKTALDNPTFGVASFQAGLARSLNQEVFHDPQHANNAHSTVRGNKTPSISNKLAKAAKILINHHSD